MPIFAGHSVSVVHYSSRYHVTEATLHQCSLFTPEESSRRLWLVRPGWSLTPWTGLIP